MVQGPGAHLGLHEHNQTEQLRNEKLKDEMVQGPCAHLGLHEHNQSYLFCNEKLKG
jgi:hypothetical protein